MKPGIIFVILACSILHLNDALTFNEMFMKQFLRQTLLSEVEDQIPDDFLECQACKLAVNKAKGQATPQFTSLAQTVFGQFCPKFYNKVICDGIKETYVDSFSIHFVSHVINSAQICVAVSACAQSEQNADIENYIKEVLKDKLTTEQVSAWTQKSTEKTSKKDFKLLHLADLHIDLEYTVGADSKCDQPFCCRPESGQPKDPKDAAQYWGSHAECDVPVRTLQNMVQHIKENLNIDMIIWTGDNISHDVWHQAQFNQTLPTEIITNEIKSRFKGVSFYPIFGNHEGYPADQFDLEGSESSWLKDEVTRMWTGMLGITELFSLRRNGYYASVNKDRNLKVIALNTQACDSLNFYLLEKITDPGNQLEWLISELKSAEKNHQYAYIFAHIPTGDAFCGSQWSSRYAVIIERFQHVIQGQFFGHTHNDHIQIVNSQVDGRPLAPIYIAPSGSTFSYKNPSFRIFDINGQDNSIKDYTQYRLNLQKANNDGPTAVLDWQVAYTFLSEYNLKSASKVEDVREILQVLEQNPEVDTYKLARFISHYNSGSYEHTVQHLKNLHSEKEAESTKTFFLCGIQTATFDDYFNCVDWRYKLTHSDFLVFQVLEKLTGSWKVPI